MSNPYIGSELQVSGVEVYELQEGKAKGMRLYEVVNGNGLRMTISPDRCADISRLSYKGDNFSYFSPVGYVAPQFYDRYQDKFLNSFTAGFLTTCGLTNAGVSCIDEGEEFPLHGVIGNTPSDHVYYEVQDDEIIIRATIRDERIFSRKLVLQREIKVSRQTNEFTITDTITNQNYKKEPVCLLYHFNIGYPLLSEHTLLTISSKEVVARDEVAQKGINQWNKMELPKGGYEEQCFAHTFDKNPVVAIFNEEIGSGLQMSFDHESLIYFTQWKMMGEREYVIGLEPGNTHVLGRDKMREEQKLVYLEPKESVTYTVKFRVLEDRKEFQELNK